MGEPGGEVQPASRAPVDAAARRVLLGDGDGGVVVSAAPFESGEHDGHRRRLAPGRDVVGEEGRGVIEGASPLEEIGLARPRLGASGATRIASSKAAAASSSRPAAASACARLQRPR